MFCLISIFIPDTFPRRSNRNFGRENGFPCDRFFFHGVYLFCRIGKTRRRKVRSQVGQRTRVRPRMYMVGYEMERFCGHSRGNSIRHTKSSAQDAPRNSTLSLNSASLKLAWLDILFSFFFFYVASFNQII